MNLLAPIYALFSLDFYRKVIRQGVGKGFLYLAYLSLLSVGVLAGVLLFRGLPAMNDFVDWVKITMPAMTWSPTEGITLEAQSPYVMTNPKLGALVTFDTTKESVTALTMGDTPIFVTATKIFVRQGAADVKVYDITRPVPEDEATKVKVTVQVTPELVQKFYDSIKPWFLAFILGFSFIFTFIWKLLAALFYSWLGLLFNFSRDPRLSYGSIFNLSIFTLTAGWIIQILPAVIPPLGAIPFWTILAIPVTVVYLFVVIKKTPEVSISQ